MHYSPVVDRGSKQFTGPTFSTAKPKYMTEGLGITRVNAARNSESFHALPFSMQDEKWRVKHSTDTESTLLRRFQERIRVVTSETDLTFRKRQRFVGGTNHGRIFVQDDVNWNFCERAA